MFRHVELLQSALAVPGAVVPGPGKELRHLLQVACKQVHAKYNFNRM